MHAGCIRPEVVFIWATKSKKKIRKEMNFTPTIKPLVDFGKGSLKTALYSQIRCKKGFRYYHRFISPQDLFGALRGELTMFEA